MGIILNKQKKTKLRQTDQPIDQPTDGQTGSEGSFTSKRNSDSASIILVRLLIEF